MKKILLACSAGMSTSLLEQSMQKYIKEKGLKYTVEAKDSATAKDHIKDYDIILLGPQVKFMEKQFKDLDPTKTVEVIPMQMYGMMKGDQVMELVLKLDK